MAAGRFRFQRYTLEIAGEWIKAIFLDFSLTIFKSNSNLNPKTDHQLTNMKYHFVKKCQLLLLLLFNNQWNISFSE